ncbi:MAG: Na/Pi cotransporter family protein [Rhizobiales bacterium]|nr:Na/Pi cotransporter family protein [Hyphomicrobiales bacterium]
MGGGSVLLNLLGAIALLLWSTRLVKTGVTRAFGEELRGWLMQATSNRLKAISLGAGVALIMQSSTAALLLLTSFAGRGMIALVPALAVALGADIGSTFVVQALSFDLKAFVPVLFILGVGGFLLSGNATIRQVGRILIGLALMILSLGMIVQASGSLRGDPTLVLVLSRLANEAVLAIVIGAGLTWLLHSSVAMVLLIVSLVGAGLIPLSLGVTFLLGANLGAGLIPLGLGWREPMAARRILVGNIAFRAIGVLIALLMLPLVQQDVAQLPLAPERAIAAGHTLFNLALALLFLPLLGPAARLLEQHLPDRPDESQAASRPVHLDDSLIETPHLALGAASREVIRLAERVEVMLRETILTFQDIDDRRRTMIHSLDDEVDSLQEAIKLYLTRLTRQVTTDEDQKQAVNLILFTTNLEHVGDIICKNLLELAAKKQRYGLAFSEAGWSELTEFHARIVKQMKLALTLFMTRDVMMARDLVAEKDNIRALEKVATERHLARLRDGTPASIETSSLHLDILRDLKRINAHITSLAHPILEASGEIRQSRLRTQKA